MDQDTKGQAKYGLLLDTNKYKKSINTTKNTTANQRNDQQLSLAKSDFDKLEKNVQQIHAQQKEELKKALEKIATANDRADAIDSIYRRTCKELVGTTQTAKQATKDIVIIRDSVENLKKQPQR